MHETHTAAQLRLTVPAYIVSCIAPMIWVVTRIKMLYREHALHQTTPGPVHTDRMMHKSTHIARGLDSGFMLGAGPWGAINVGSKDTSKSSLESHLKVSHASTCLLDVPSQAQLLLLACVGGLTSLPVRVPFMVSCSSSCLCLPAHYCVSL